MLKMTTRNPYPRGTFVPALVLVALVLAACALVLTNPDSVLGSVPASPTKGTSAPDSVLVVNAPACHEDEPCWTWSRMGNRKRGIVSLWGTSLVVGPCRYARMYARAVRLVGKRDAARLLGPRLRGDAWARAHGCDPARNPATSNPSDPSLPA